MEHCESDDGNGCGGFFANKTSNGLCAKCRKLSSLAEGSAEHNLWKDFRQCTGCGLAWKNLQTELCGGCVRVSSTAPKAAGISEPNLVRVALDTSRLARADALDARLHKQPPPPLRTSSGLLAAQYNVTPTGDAKIFISVQCRVKSASRREQSQTDLDCGQWGKPWAKTDYLSEVLDDSLETLNNRWNKEHKLNLNRDEVEFRWSGNLVFLPNTANNTVGQVYTEYLTGDMAMFYAQSDTKGRRGSGPKNQLMMFLELYIDKPAFMARLKKHRRGLDSVPGRKRSATTTSLPSEDKPGSKRHAGFLGDDAYKSSFVRTSRGTVAGSTAAVSTINLEKAHTTCDLETGQVEIVWLDDAETSRGFLSKEVFASGTTKHVYQLTLDSELFVAKRFFEIGSDDPITSDENSEYLKCELIRLKTAAWFLKKFKAAAKEMKIDIATNIILSDGFLAREVGTPSEASGLQSFEAGTSAVWLVEPRRTKTVLKFSGTLNHPNRQDKVGFTISAFAHFAYQVSNKELVFADIQGSPMNIQGRDTIVLFDIMSHSPTSDSGIGDHGPDGIKSFLSQHRCNHICTRLKLCLLGEKETDHDDSEEHDEEVDELDKD